MDFWPFLKLQKMDLIDFMSFFGPNFFFNFLPYYYVLLDLDSFLFTFFLTKLAGAGSWRDRERQKNAEWKPRNRDDDGPPRRDFDRQSPPRRSDDAGGDRGGDNWRSGPPRGGGDRGGDRGGPRDDRGPRDFRGPRDDRPRDRDDRGPRDRDDRRFERRDDGGGKLGHIYL